MLHTLARLRQRQRHVPFLEEGHRATSASTRSGSAAKVVTMDFRLDFHASQLPSTRPRFPPCDAQPVAAKLASANTCVGSISPNVH